MSKLTVVTVDSLVMQVVNDANGEVVTTEMLQESIEAKPATLAAALRRCEAKGLVVRTGRGKYTTPDPAVTALLEEAHNAEIDAHLLPNGRVSIPMDTLRAMLED